MAGFRFKKADLEKEITVLKSMSKSFLKSETTWVLDQFLTELKIIGRAPEGKIYSLELHDLHTRPSVNYEPGQRSGGKSIYAIVSGIWDLKPIGRASLPKRKIEFCGIASTTIELYDINDPETRLAMWRLELGDSDSPGCYVHSHILGDLEEPPFPKSVSIPRLPSLFITPMSAIEFVLGELFQDEWARITGSSKSDVQLWNEFQRKCLQKLMRWYGDQITSSSSSPWIALKSAKPEGETAVL